MISRISLRKHICPKALALPDRLNHPDRLLTPLKRTGSRGDGKWAAISWETALAEISHRMLEAKGTYGARSVAFCQGMPKGMEHFALIRLANLFGSPNVVATQDVCHAPREITGLHTCGFYPVTDFHHRSRLVILWGSNLTATNEEGEICRPLLDQMKAGTRIIVVDPRKTALADKAEQWLQIQPGTDHALALAFLEVIIRENLYMRIPFFMDHGPEFQDIENFALKSDAILDKKYGPPGIQFYQQYNHDEKWE